MFSPRENVGHKGCGNIRVKHDDVRYIKGLNLFQNNFAMIKPSLQLAVKFRKENMKLVFLVKCGSQQGLMRHP